MIAQEEREIKAKIKLTGTSQRDIAVYLGIPYSTLSTYLGGFAPMPEDLRKKTEDYLAKNYQNYKE